MRNDFLAHHGILGQKWGIRRYQNPDGTLTDAGRKRYGVDTGKELPDVKSASGIERRLNDVDKAKARNIRKMGKNISKINKKQWAGTNSKYAKKVSEAQEYIKMGNEETESLLKKADELGYSVDSAHTRRLTSSGAEIIGRTLLATGIASAISWPLTGRVVALTSWTTVGGTKYKVKEPKK